MMGELTKDQIDSVLRSEMIGRIGCHAEGHTYVVPVSYAYDGQHVYAHSADGLKVRTMRSNPRICLEVEQIDNLANWRCVIGQGTYEELHDADEDRARRLLSERFAPFITSETAPSHAWPRTEQDSPDDTVRRSIFYRIRLIERTGRYEKR
jgi:nitroimidazol reductase NimA-like FMN-containing flavoprotein (pyridoxamine 5'-phosphate oxidase superfamily)